MHLRRVIAGHGRLRLTTPTWGVPGQGEGEGASYRDRPTWQCIQPPEQGAVSTEPRRLVVDIVYSFVNLSVQCGWRSYNTISKNIIRFNTVLYHRLDRLVHDQLREIRGIQIIHQRTVAFERTRVEGCHTLLYDLHATYFSQLVHVQSCLSYGTIQCYSG